MPGKDTIWQIPATIWFAVGANTIHCHNCSQQQEQIMKGEEC